MRMEALEEKMTIKQKDYLSFLMTTIQNDKIRQDLQKRMILLSKAQASNIIDAIVSGSMESIVNFF